MSTETEQETPSGPSRRSFLDGALKTGGCLCAAGMVAPAAAYLWPARAQGPDHSTVKAGMVEEYEIGDAHMVQSYGRPILILRKSENEFKAFSAICTHLGCIVQWKKEEKTIDCPCHAAVFSQDGKVVSGPPPAPLNRKFQGLMPHIRR